MKLKSVKRRKGQRGRKRRSRVFDNTATMTGRMSLQRLTMSWAVDRAKVLSLVCLAVLMWLLFYFFTSERFFVYGVELSGNQFVSVEEIFEQSDLDSLSIFFVHPSEVSQRLLELANIKGAQVTVRLPNRVAITVTERSPQVIVKIKGLEYWVDSEGIILPARGHLEQAIVVVVEDDIDLKPGDSFDVEALHTAQQLHELLPEVSRVAYSQATGVSVTADQGWSVVFGNSENLPAKVAIYSSLMKRLGREGTEVAVVDLRYEGKPYYRMRGE